MGLYQKTFIDIAKLIASCLLKSDMRVAFSRKNINVWHVELAIFQIDLEDKPNLAMMV